MQNQTKVIMMLEDLHEQGYNLKDLADLIRSLEQIAPKENSDQQAEERILNAEITNSLMEIGIAPNLIGFEYIKEAIKIIYNDSSYIYAITTKLYVDIANKYGGTVHSVERSIRNAIITACETMDSSTRTKYFKNMPFKSNGKLTNAQFLAIMADFFKVKHNKM